MDDGTREWRRSMEESAAAYEGTGIPPKRLQYLVNRAASCLSDLQKELGYNMAEVRIVTSLMKGATDLWHSTQGK